MPQLLIINRFLRNEMISQTLCANIFRKKFATSRVMYSFKNIVITRIKQMVKER